ncbi:hypothetical protein [Streptomyces sp. CdTB01]|uniref:hypothetical protein n=1 Tax=Streptomyces sp. CdTB01 TaxID=1725411 RepID=UPI000A5AF9F7|nr:hypothetical protein [Streptomyces sp. CdTB01]
MTHFSPPGAPRARIPSPRQPRRPEPRIRSRLRTLFLWAGLTVSALALLLAYAARP